MAQLNKIPFSRRFLPGKVIGPQFPSFSFKTAESKIWIQFQIQRHSFFKDFVFSGIFFIFPLLASQFFFPMFACQPEKESYTLILADAKTGQRYIAYQLPAENSFSVLFTHSVNKTEVEEGYIVQEGDIFLEWCKYRSFGAGVATTVEDGQSLVYTDDGSMLIRGFNRPVYCLGYAVSTVYDHFLRLGTNLINLTDAGLKGKYVLFIIERSLHDSTQNTD